MQIRWLTIFLVSLIFTAMPSSAQVRGLNHLLNSGGIQYAPPMR